MHLQGLSLSYRFQKCNTSVAFMAKNHEYHDETARLQRIIDFIDLSSMHSLAGFEKKNIQSHQPRQPRVLKVAKSVNWLTTKSSSAKTMFQCCVLCHQKWADSQMISLYIHTSIYIYIYGNESWDLNPTNVTYNNLRGCF